MIHKTIVDEVTQDIYEDIAKRMPHAAVKAIFQMNRFTWEHTGEGGISNTGAAFLWWHYKHLGLCERRKTGGTSHRERELFEYRLTSIGLAIRNVLVSLGIK